MNSRRSRRDATGRTTTAHGRPAPYMPTAIDVFAKVRGHERARAAARRARGRPAALLPPRSSRPAAPVVEMEGAERIMLGSNNYLGLTGDARVIAGRARRARALRHRPDRLAPAQRHDRRCTSSSSARSPSGWAPRRRSSSRPATRPTSARSARCSAPGDTVIADSGDHASILDGCLLSRAKLRPFRHNRLDKLEKMLERAAERRRRRARRRRRRVLDGGRHRRRCREIVELCEALRRAADGRRGARRRRARRARRRHVASCSASRTASTCAWARSRSRSPPAAASSPARTRSSTSCASSRARSCSPPRPCRPRSAPRWPRCGSSARARARRCSRACSTTRATSTRRAARARLPRRPADAARRRRHADRPGAGRRRLEGRAALARALRRRRLRQHRAAPGGAARRARCCARA